MNNKREGEEAIEIVEFNFYSNYFTHLRLIKIKTPLTANVREC